MVSVQATVSIFGSVVMATNYHWHSSCTYTNCLGRMIFRHKKEAGGNYMTLCRIFSSYTALSNIIHIRE